MTPKTLYRNLPMQTYKNFSRAPRAVKRCIEATPPHSALPDCINLTSLAFCVRFPVCPFPRRSRAACSLLPPGHPRIAVISRAPRAIKRCIKTTRPDSALLAFVLPPAHLQCRHKTRVARAGYPGCHAKVGNGQDGGRDEESKSTRV